MRRPFARVTTAAVVLASIAVTACSHEAPRARVLGVRYTLPPTTTMPAATSTSAAADPDAESLSPGVYVERDDSDGYFRVGGDTPASGHATQLDRSVRRLTFEIWVTPLPDGTAEVLATLTNTAGRVIRLAGGAQIRLHLARDGEAPELVTVSDPTLTEIAPAATVQVRGATALAGDGFYTYWAETTIELA